MDVTADEKDLTRIVAKPYRAAVTVLVAVILLGGGSFSAWAYAQSSVDARIEAKTNPMLIDHDKRLTVLEADDKQQREHWESIDRRLGEIETLITHRLPDRDQGR